MGWVAAWMHPHEKFDQNRVGAGAEFVLNLYSLCLRLAVPCLATAVSRSLVPKNAAQHCFARNGLADVHRDR